MRKELGIIVLLAAAGLADSLSAETIMTYEEARTRELAVQAALLAQYELEFQAQDRASPWAGSTEQQLMQGLSEIPGLTANRLDVACRERICRAVVVFPLREIALRDGRRVRRALQESMGNRGMVFRYTFVDDEVYTYFIFQGDRCR